MTAKLKQFQGCHDSGMVLQILQYGTIFSVGTSVVNRKKLQGLQIKGLRCALSTDYETSLDDVGMQNSLGENG